MNLGQMRRPWQADTGPNRYRRGLYTFFWRATPEPVPDHLRRPGGVQTCTRRFRSNTPLQALTLLNDPAFVEIARGLAARIVDERPDPRATATGSGMPSCSAWAAHPRAASSRRWKRCSGTSAEARRVTSRLERGSTVARVLLNLDEFVTRE